ncbi:MAG: hypothetical protein RRY15_02940, partial [Bacteroidales bacterium]
NELIGWADLKPFECIGTVEEVNWALQQLLSKPDYQTSYLLQQYAKNPLAKKKIREDLVKDFQDAHFVPEPFAKLLIQELRSI